MPRRRIGSRLYSLINLQKVEKQIKQFEMSYSVILDKNKIYEGKRVLTRRVEKLFPFLSFIKKGKKRK